MDGGRNLIRRSIKLWTRGVWGSMPRVRDKGRSPLSAVNAPTWRVPLPDATCALVGVTSFRGLSCQTHVGRPRRPDILPSREKERERKREEKETMGRGEIVVSSSSCVARENGAIINMRY